MADEILQEAQFILAVRYEVRLEQENSAGEFLPDDGIIGTVSLLIGFGLSFAAKRVFPLLTQGNYEFPLAVASLLLAVPATMALG